MHRYREESPQRTLRETPVLQPETVLTVEAQAQKPDGCAALTKVRPREGRREQPLVG